MFIMTAKLNKKKAVALVLLLGLILVAIILIAGGASRAGQAAPSPQAVDTNEGRIAFLEAYGWQISPEPLETQQVIIPKEFPEVYQDYNALQLEQGFDLTAYAGRQVTRYSYELLNHPSGQSDVRVNLLVCGQKLIGGDICSLRLDGFMHGLRPPEQSTDAA